MLKGRIRDATPSDAEAIQKIYAPFVADTITSFEYQVPSVQEMEDRIKKISVDYPYLVYENGEDGVIGYAYGSQYKTREGYKWVVETSIYLAPNARGKGIGYLLYERLLHILTDLGYYKAVAGISGKNPTSDAFHKKFGFKQYSFVPDFGNKFGKWIDTTWYYKELLPVVDNPTPPIPYSSQRIK